MSWTCDNVILGYPELLEIAVILVILFDFEFCWGLLEQLISGALACACRTCCTDSFCTCHHCACWLVPATDTCFCIGCLWVCEAVFLLRVFECSFPLASTFEHEHCTQRKGPLGSPKERQQPKAHSPGQCFWSRARLTTTSAANLSAETL